MLQHVARRCTVLHGVAIANRCFTLLSYEVVALLWNAVLVVRRRALLLRTARRASLVARRMLYAICRARRAVR
eukprot:8997928-Lingulodinium_polyedra.AAC.1